MQATLLSTKLYVPPIRANLVARPRLVAMLANAMPKGFTLVSAPAGYGKTTLVSSWLREAGLPCAWLSLEESDNDPVSFLQYLLNALQPIVPSIHVDLLELIEASQSASFQGLMNILINEIARQDQPFVLVLDDFHLIHDATILDLISFLLDHLPAQQMQLVLITRADPPLPLSRLRVRAQMTEIRAEQLRFTPDEVTSFVNGVMGLHLPAKEISAIHERTEGWVAGLQLAGLSMQGCQDVSGFITEFSGSHHYIVDYLADEVLRRLDEPTRAFLLQTSILSRVCASLCDSLVQPGEGEQPVDGQSMLESLERKNLFIIPLDEQRRWYRYHHLFADALNRRLEHQHPELLPGLYQRASEWYEANGLIGEAIQYALRAGQQDRVARLVDQNGCYLLMSGELFTLLKWMDAVEPYFQAYPGLVIQKGWALTLAGRMEPAEQTFQLAEQLVRAQAASEAMSANIGNISAGRAYWADIQGNISEAARLAQQALDLLPDTDQLSQSIRSVAMGSLARTVWFSGDLVRARQIFDQAMQIGRAANNIEMIINTSSDIGEVLMEQGRLVQAERLLSETLPLTVRPDGQRMPLSARIYAGLSKINYEWNRFDQAEIFAQQAIEVGRLWGSVEQHTNGAILLAKMCHARGEAEKGRQWMDVVERLASEDSVYMWRAIHNEAALDQFWLSTGSLERVTRRMEGSGIQPDDEIPYRYEPRYLTLLRVLLARGEYAPTLPLAQRMLQKARDDQRMLRAVELLVLQALSYLGMKDTRAATACMAQAVALAEPEGYKRVFLDEGEGVAKLLYLVRASQDPSGYAGELLAAFGPQAGPMPKPGALLVEPLSGREVEVLRLVEAGLSNQQIASKLFLSITTVKRHISNIYAKLEVQTRTQAIARGRELGFFSG